MHMLVAYIYIMYKAYVSPGWEQQIMLFLKYFRLQRQPSNLLLGRGGVFFGVGSFWVRYYGSGPTKG
jgi:hypothetical protein